MRGLLNLSQRALAASQRAYSSSSTPERKVAILGAAGGIGQPLGLLMKVSLNCIVKSRCRTVPEDRSVHFIIMQIW